MALNNKVHIAGSSAGAGTGTSTRASVNTLALHRDLLLQDRQDEILCRVLELVADTDSLPYESLRQSIDAAIRARFSFTQCRCSTCGQWWEARTYHRDKTAKSGRRSVCKFCVRQANNDRYWRDGRGKVMERRREATRRWREKVTARRGTIATAITNAITTTTREEPTTCG